jgi:hypothetical protein
MKVSPHPKRDRLLQTHVKGGWYPPAHAEAARGLEKYGRVRLAWKLERLGINSIHAGIEMIVQPCGVQYRGCVFA